MLQIVNPDPFPGLLLSLVYRCVLAGAVVVVVVVVVVAVAVVVVVVFKDFEPHSIFRTIGVSCLWLCPGRWGNTVIGHVDCRCCHKVRHSS